MYGFAALAGGVGTLLASAGLAWVVVPVPFVAVLGYQSWFATTLHRYRARAFAALDVGDYDGAAAVYDQLARRRNVHFKVAGMVGAATVAMRRARTDEADSLFAELVRYPSRVPAEWRSVASEYLAIGSALAGDDDRAQRRLAAGELLTPVTMTACAVVDARAARFDDVLDLPVPGLRRREARLFAHELRVFHLMRTYAAAQGGEPHTDDRMLARPAFEAEYDYLLADWPELRAYLEAHPLPAIGVADDATLPRARLLN